MSKRWEFNNLIKFVREGKRAMRVAGGDDEVLATETKLEQVRHLLSGVATENKLEQARVLLSEIKAKDFATNTELQGVKSKLVVLENKLDTLADIMTDGSQKVQQSGTIVSDSSKTKPEGSEGQWLIWWDTKQTFCHDGEDWREF